MVEHRCERCDASFPTQLKLERHLDRKFPCDQGAYSCPKCHRRFAQRQGRCRHAASCNGPPLTDKDHEDTIATLRAVVVLQQQALAAATTCEEASLSAGASTSNTAAGSVCNAVHTNGNHNHTDNSVNDNSVTNVTINHVCVNWGDEDMGLVRGLSIEKLKELVGPFLQDHSSLVKFIELVRMNPDNPQNHNMLLANADAKQVAVHSNDQWAHKDCDVHLRNTLGLDAQRLSDKLAGDEDLRDYRMQYLAGVMARNGANDTEGLSREIKALRGPLAAFTQARYVNDEAGDALGDLPPIPVLPTAVGTAPTASTALLAAAGSEAWQLRMQVERTRQLQLELQIEQLRRQPITVERTTAPAGSAEA